MKVQYVNAYRVTRHEGGPEEGGSWYNAGEPLASMPMVAEERPGCVPGTCNKCDEARKGVQGASFCEEERSDEDVEDAFHEWLVQDYKGNWSHALMREAFKARRREESSALAPFFEHHTYRGACKRVTHLVVDPTKVEVIKAQVTEAVGHMAWGNIYSMAGGAAIEFRVEDAMAEAWSDYVPYS